MERFDVFTLFYYAIYLIAIDIRYIRYSDIYEGFICLFQINSVTCGFLCNPETVRK